MQTDNLDLSENISIIKGLIKENINLSLDYLNTGLDIDKNNLQIINKIFFLMNYMESKLM